MIMQISYIINEISRKWYTEELEGEEKAMEKENGGFFNPTIKKFWNCLYQEAVDLKQCEKYIVDAIALVSDEFGLIKVEMELTIPPNRYQLHGEQRSVMLAAKEGFGESTDFSFAFTTGGNVVFHVVWDEEQTDYGRDELEILLRDVFFWYDRNMRQNFLEQILNTDMETGAANPYAFTGFAGMLMARGILERYCVVFFNIHNFKYVNKVFSYAEGDLILRQYTSQIQALLQEEENLARLGGDNFVALVRTENTDAFIWELQEMKVFFSNKLKSQTFIFGATIGVSRLEKVLTVREVMSRASIAYQEARSCGVGGVVWYSDQIYQEMMERQNVISNFASIMEQGGFVVYYQPKVDSRTDRICGAEALVRWVQDGKLVPPVKFIPQLEQEGSICRLDYYVLEQVCRLIKSREERGEENVCISVNFSRKHLEEVDFVEHVIRVIDQFGISHHYIEVELTESEDFQQYGIMSGIVEGFKKYGIHTAIDDFGTGFSSLNMLKKVDLDIVKIDKSFIPLEEEYAGKDKDMMMLWSIVELLHQLGKEMVAEGVETKQQLDYLEKVGCHIIQGYVFDKPLPQKDFEERLLRQYQ